MESAISWLEKNKNSSCTKKASNKLDRPKLKQVQMIGEMEREKYKLYLRDMTPKLYALARAGHCRIAK